MDNVSLPSIFINAALVNNFVLAYFLGICPFLGVSAKLETATRMGASVCVVMVVSSVCAYGIVVIASMVQLVEMFVRKVSPALFRALGVFLPLITTNCAILGLALFQTNKGYDLPQSIVYALGAGAGFTLALILMAGIREKLELATLPNIVEGTSISLMIAGILSLAFMGFAGLG
jgi:electron transport complex protein RnfA